MTRLQGIDSRKCQAGGLKIKYPMGLNRKGKPSVAFYDASFESANGDFKNVTPEAGFKLWVISARIDLSSAYILETSATRIDPGFDVDYSLIRIEKLSGAVGAKAGDKIGGGK